MEYELIKYKSMAKYMNDRILTDYFYRLMLIARSVFEWENLPNGIDEKWIERFLFAEGKCVFFKDKTNGFMVARMTPNGKLNYYDEPTTVRPHAIGYTGDDLENGVDCVVIRNNDDMIPTSPTIQLYAMKLANIDRTIDVNIQAQKIPLIVKCSEKQKLSLKRVIDARNDNEPVIFGDKGLDTESIEVLKTEAPIVFDKLELQKHMVWNECMTFLGINNANMDKRERLVDDEVQANNEQVEASFNMMLKARERACEEINRVFNLKGDKAVKVKKRIQYTSVLDGADQVQDIKDGESND